MQAQKHYSALQFHTAANNLMYTYKKENCSKQLWNRVQCVVTGDQIVHQLRWLDCGPQKRGITVWFPVETRYITCFKAATPTLATTQPPVQQLTEELSQWVKWLGREGDHSPTSHAKLQMSRTKPSLPQYVFKACTEIFLALAHWYFSLLASCN
jgi:hypothetical protein